MIFLILSHGDKLEKSNKVSIYKYRGDNINLLISLSCSINICSSVSFKMDIFSSCNKDNNISCTTMLIT